jgi:xanthine dehydrogenase accessory factor
MAPGCGASSRGLAPGGGAELASAGMTNEAESVLELAETWLDAGQRVAWATVVGTWRSSPRPLGSQMVIASDGRFAGSVSGGCVEGAVIEAAGELLRGARPTTLAYGVSSESAWEVGLPCGGKIEIFLAELDRPLLRPLLAARRGRDTLACLTDLDRARQELWQPGASSADEGAASLILRDAPALHAALEQAFQTEQTQLLEIEGRRVFVHILGAPLRLIVVGAVHLTQVLAQFNEAFGFELIVVDPRTAFATPERFPRARLVHDWPDVALQQLAPDRRTAVVVLSHDAKLDEPALLAALRSDCFYLGALGSQRTQQARRRRLLDEGISEQALERLHGPIGLDIGALTTPEIAVSILAELIQVRRRMVPA